MSLPSGRRRLRWRPTPDTALALTALVLAAGGGGYALGAGSDQVITACFDPAAPQVVQTITSGSCAGGQTALSWNQTGPQGSQGIQGPAGKDAPAVSDLTVVALPPKPSLRRRSAFSVSLQLPSPGTYQIDGHVAWSQTKISADVPIDCSIARTQPATVLDTLKTTVLKDDLFNVGAIDESALTTVTAPAPTDPVTGPVAPLAVPVTVTFRCTATTKNAKRILFHDWTLSATPVKVSTIQKKA